MKGQGLRQMVDKNRLFSKVIHFRISSNFICTQHIKQIENKGTHDPEWLA